MIFILWHNLKNVFKKIIRKMYTIIYKGEMYYGRKKMD